MQLRNLKGQTMKKNIKSATAQGWYCSNINGGMGGKKAKTARCQECSCYKPLVLTRQTDSVEQYSIQKVPSWPRWQIFTHVDTEPWSWHLKPQVLRQMNLCLVIRKVGRHPKTWDTSLLDFTDSCELNVGHTPRLGGCEPPPAQSHSDKLAEDCAQWVLTLWRAGTWSWLLAQFAKRVAPSQTVCI